MRTGESHENIVKLSGIREKKLRALSPYGPVKAGLTTLPSQRIVREENEVRLMELLNSLENVVDSLNFKSFTVYDTLNTAIEDLRVALSHTTKVKGGTDDWTAGQSDSSRYKQMGNAVAVPVVEWVIGNICDIV